MRVRCSQSLSTQKGVQRLAAKHKFIELISLLLRVRCSQSLSVQKGEHRPAAKHKFIELISLLLRVRCSQCLSTQKEASPTCCYIKTDNDPQRKSSEEGRYTKGVDRRIIS